MAILIPPKLAYKGSDDKYHFLMFPGPFVLFAACGRNLRNPEGSPDIVPVVELDVKDICEHCLGAMEAVDGN